MYGHFMRTPAPLVQYHPQPSVQDTYASIIGDYLKPPSFLIVPYPGLNFNSKENILEIDIYIEQSQVHPTNQALWEYLYNHYPDTALRISLWNWHRDGSVHENPTFLDPNLIHDLRTNFKFLYNKISNWCEVQFDLTIVGALVGPSDISRISGSPKSLRKLEVKEIQSATINGQLPDALNLLLNRLWGCTNLRFLDTAYQNFYHAMFPGFPYQRLSELRVDMVLSVAQVVELLHLCPMLHKAFFKELSGPLLTPDGKTIMATCRNLTHLTLKNENNFFDDRNYPFTGMICNVLDNLSAPALKELSVGYDHSWSSSSFKRFIGNSKCALERLKFVSIKMTSTQFHSALSQTPHLKELKVRGHTPDRGKPYDILFTSHLLKEMTQRGNMDCICPRLQRLEMTYPSIQSGLFPMMVHSPILWQKLSLLEAPKRDIGRDDVRALGQLERNGLSVYLDGTPFNEKFLAPPQAPRPPPQQQRGYRPY